MLSASKKQPKPPIGLNLNTKGQKKQKSLTKFLGKKEKRGKNKKQKTISGFPKWGGKLKRHQQSEKVLPPFCYISTLSSVDSLEEKRYIKTHTGYFVVMKISGIDIYNYKQADKASAFQNFAQAETRLALPHKYIFMDASPVMDAQKAHISYKLDGITHEYRRYLLERQLNRFDVIEKEQKDRLSYLMIFGETREELDKSIESYTAEMRDTAITVLEDGELIQMLSDYAKFGYEEQSVIDANILNNILPDGLEIFSNYFKLGEKYITSVIAYKFPSYIDDLLFAGLFSMPGVQVTLDVSFKIKAQVKKEIKNSMDELQSRSVVEKSSAENVSNVYEYKDLEELFIAIDRGNEQILSTTMRFWVASHTLAELSAVSDDIKKTLTDSGIESMIAGNEMEYEYRALTEHSDIVGQAMPLYETYSKQYPFYYQQLMDEQGLYCGQTSTGGQVVLDTFKQCPGRESFDIILIGVKGSGKSVTLKSMVQEIVALGHKGFVLDVDREYGGLAAILGGKVIKFGKSSRLNPLQLRVMGDMSVEDDYNNFSTEFSRIETFMYQYIPSLTTFEADEFKGILQQVYKDKGITDSTDISILAAEDFPIFSDVLATLRSKLYSRYVSEDNNEFSEKISERRKERLEQLEVYLKDLSEGIYSGMFSGYSNIDIANEQFVIFDVKDIAEMGDRVYNAQLFNILSLMWNEICNNRVQNSKITKEIDRHYVAALIDEAHRFINAKNTLALDFIEKLVRRARKYDAGLWFASQSILDFMPNNTQVENADKIVTIFSLVQYKMLMKQSDSSADTLMRVFPQFTMSELQQTALFAPGETLLSLGGGKQKIRFLRFIPKADLQVFGGGRESANIKIVEGAV